MMSRCGRAVAGYLDRPPAFLAGVGQTRSTGMRVH